MFSLAESILSGFVLGRAGLGCQGLDHVRNDMYTLILVDTHTIATVDGIKSDRCLNDLPASKAMCTESDHTWDTLIFMIPLLVYHHCASTKCKNLILLDMTGCLSSKLGLARPVDSSINSKKKRRK
jgi:hypothetical protein